MFVKCKICDGKEYFVPRGWNGVSFHCSTCHGTGGFDVPDGKDLCPKCNGSGQIAEISEFGFGIEASCKICSGTGFVDKTAE